MFPTSFAYHRAESVADAIAMLGANPDAKLLAGGHSLIPAMKLRLAAPEMLVDITRLEELKGVQVGADGVTIGALATYNDVRDAPGIDASFPILNEAIHRIGDQQVRAHGTIGGTLAHADPASDLTAVFLALDGQLDVQGADGKRTIPAEALFVDLWTTSLKADEVVTSISLPQPAPGTIMGYAKHAHPASGYAVVGIAVVITRDADIVGSARICVTGATSIATRASAAESALIGQPLTKETVAAAAAVAANGLEINGDHYASEEYRANLIRVLTRRIIERIAGL
ncbi:MAG: xanthine dehydrogenase family protein subunit M [Chloroflexia bacterium]|nr:xanthine dehydrogenase family protein subunit M [Chloroflexia bacterium]